MPKDENNYILRGKAKINLNDQAGALTDFNSAVELNPKNYDTWLYRGIAKINMNNKSGCCSDLTKAVALGSKDAADDLKKYCR
jgi:Flp pilus assembly protein TadD